MRVMTVETLTENDVYQMFNGIAPDLAECCRAAGERERIHVDDLADAIYNQFEWRKSDGRPFRVRLDDDSLGAAFRKIKGFIRKRLTDRRGGSWVSL